MACSVGRLRRLNISRLNAANNRNPTPSFLGHNSGNVLLGLPLPLSQYLVVGRPFVFCFLCRTTPSPTISPSVFLNTLLLIFMPRRRCRS